MLMCMWATCLSGKGDDKNGGERLRANMCHSPEQTFTGDIRRFVINVPRRLGKSITTTVAFCAWLLGRDPTPNILMSNYNEGLARQHDQQPQQIMGSHEYRAGRTPWRTRSSGTDRRWERISASHDLLPPLPKSVCRYLSAAAAVSMP